MFGKPRAKGRGYDGCVLGLVHQASLLSVLQGRLDVLEEGQGKGVAFVDIWNIAVEAGLGVIVSEEADVLEFPAEDWLGELVSDDTE